MSLLRSNVGELLDRSTPALVSNLDNWQFNSNVGIEVEVENFNWDERPSVQSWEATTDSSLRNNGCEMISRIVSGLNVYRAVHNLAQYFEEHQPQADFNERCSVHVHVDVTDLTVQQLHNLCYLTVGLEPLLMRMVAPHRLDNNFCLQVKQADNIVSKLRNMFSSTNARQFRDRACAIRPSDYKYAATNFANIHRLGTIEYRMHQGTANKQTLLEWISVLCRIKDLAKSYESVDQIRNSKINNELAEMFMADMAMSASPNMSLSEVVDILDDSFEFANDINSRPNVDMSHILRAFRVEPEPVEVPQATEINAQVDTLRARLNGLRDRYNQAARS